MVVFMQGVQDEKLPFKQLACLCGDSTLTSYQRETVNMTGRKQASSVFRQT